MALSLGASFGLSVLGVAASSRYPVVLDVLALAVILLLAVGSDYNLLLISRFKEEIGAGFEHRHHPCDGRHRQVVTAHRPGVRRHYIVRVQ